MYICVCVFHFKTTFIARFPSGIPPRSLSSGFLHQRPAINLALSQNLVCTVHSIQYIYVVYIQYIINVIFCIFEIPKGFLTVM